MAKGIRVNQLAKELGYQSKEILDRCKAEGLAVPNHMTVLSAGLEATLREWFPLRQEGAAVATAAPAPAHTADEPHVALTTKVKAPSRSRKKKTDGTGDEHHAVETAVGDLAAGRVASIDATGGGVAVAEAPAAVQETVPAAPVSEAPTTGEHQPPAKTTTGPAHAEAAPTAPVTPAETRAHLVAGQVPAAVSEAPAKVKVESPATETAAATTETAPAAAPAEAATAAAAEHVTPTAPPGDAATAAPAVETAPAPAAGAAAAGGAAPTTAAPAQHPPKHGHGHGEGGRGQPRPTVSIDSLRAAKAQQTPGVQLPPPVRKPVTPAPQLLAPQPAKIQGPRVVREERPEVVPAPRPRRPMDTSSPGPTTMQARAQTGRGVRVSEDEDDSGDRGKKAGAKPGSPRSNSGRRRGSADGRFGDAIDKIKEFSEQDLADRRRRIAESSKHRQDFDSHLKKSSERGHHQPAKTVAERGSQVRIEEPITVKSLAAALGIKASELMGKLLKQGIFANINQGLDTDTAEALALEFGVEIKVVQQASLEEELEAEFAAPSDASQLVPRPPVVTILGHVDHGKTSLLDKIRHANVAAGEAGGITQHTAAWMVTLGEGDTTKKVTFIDTPGHEAFTKMRARGALMTDVVVLVVSAAEGVQPQTIESINHARAAEVPIVVALNKIDRPDANEPAVLGQLAAQGLNPVEWGGETEIVRTSAVTGRGIEDLIEILDYQSQLLELKTDPTVPARGRVIESRVDEGLGAVATVLVQDGTLRVGDIILAGAGYGRIRSLVNDRGEMVEQATAATPVIVSGLDQVPSAGDKFYIVKDMERARSIAEERAMQSRQLQLASQNKVTTADNLLASMREGEISTINLIIKGDVQGSVETLVQTVTNSNTDEVKVRVIHAGVGSINESDVELAIATMSKPTDNRVSIIGFNVIPEEAARSLAERNHVELKLYRVIYEIFDDLKKALSGMLEPEIREKLHGHAEIRQVFRVSRVGNIAGCMVTDGHIQRGSRIRLIRNGAVITQELSLESLKRVKDDVREVKAGFECGLKIAGYDDIKVGDILEAYITEKIQRTL